MSPRAHVQIKQPEYGVCCLSSWARGKAYDYLVSEEVNVFTGDSGAYSDVWEVEVPANDRMKEVIAKLRANPKCLDTDGENREYAIDLADILQEGLDSAEKENYDYIYIDWF